MGLELDYVSYGSDVLSSCFLARLGLFLSSFSSFSAKH